MDRREDGRFIFHESFKDLKARRAEQEVYRKALEEQIMQRKKLQEEEREREKYEYRKVQQNAHGNEHVDVVDPNGCCMTKQNIQPPNSFRSPHPQHKQLQHCPSPHKTSQNLQPLPSPSFHGNGNFLQNLNEVDNFNEPHPAAFVPTMEERDYFNGTDETTPPSSTAMPNIPPDCMKYIQQVLPDFTLPIHMNDRPQEKELGASQFQVPAPSAGTSSKYNNQPFSSGTSSESSSYEDVLKANKNVPLVVPKVHVSQTSEQLAGVKVSRTQYRAELQQQIEERRKREEEHRKREQEAEERIQEKIRIEQEKMQREYEEELRKQQEKELEVEKKRLATLGKHNEILKAKAEEKMNARQKRLFKHPPSQRGATNLKLIEHDNLSTAADSCESVESIQSICDFFDTAMPPTLEPTSRRPGKYVNPDDRVIPVVANKLKEETERKMLENSTLDSNPGKGLNGESFSMSKSTETVLGDSTISKFNLNHVDDTSDSETSERVLRGRSLTARICSAFDESAVQDNHTSRPSMAREIAIRSAPCPTITDSAANPTTGREFLTSLKSYLEDEKCKLMERIQARGSKSNEGF